MDYKKRQLVSMVVAAIAMVIAPTDTSDWEMQPAEEDTPDTGERIKD